MRKFILFALLWLIAGFIIRDERTILGLSFVNAAMLILIGDDLKN